MNDVKNETEWKVRSKTRQTTNAAIDSLLTPSKTEDKKESKKSKSKQPASQTAAASSSSKTESDNMSVGEGFIKLSVSATEVFKGGTVLVTGTSVKYGSLSDVKMIVTGNGESEEEDLKLYENGSFTTGWDAEQAGEFTISVKSSDGKDQQSAKVKVYDIDVMDDLWVKDDEQLTHKTYDKLKAEAERVEALLAEKDKAELEKAMDEVEKNVDAVIKLYTDLTTAVKGLGNIIKKGSSLSPNLYDNLSLLNDKLNEQQVQMQKMYDAANHEPYDNTVCEYLVMLNEACAAFSTFTNIWSKSIATILKNIVLGQSNSQSCRDSK
jgi:hypothetical protein